MISPGLYVELRGTVDAGTLTTDEACVGPAPSPYHRRGFLGLAVTAYGTGRVG